MNLKALITGASSGIGFAYAQYLSDQGWDLSLISNNDKRSKFPCELSILLVLLNRKIIPNHSNFIEVLTKL